MRNLKNINIRTIKGKRDEKRVIKNINMEEHYDKTFSIIDSAAEDIYRLTSARQAALGKKIIRLNFFDINVNSMKYNPLHEIRIGTEYEYSDAETLACAIHEPKGKDETIRTAPGRNLLICLILHTLNMSKRTNKTASLEDIYYLLNGAKPLHEYLSEIVVLYGEKKYGQDIYGEPSPEYTEPSVIDNIDNYLYEGGSYVGCLAMEFLKMEEYSKMQIGTDVSNSLSIFINPIISKIMSCEESDITYEKILRANDICSIYIEIPPSKIHQYFIIVKIFILNMLHYLETRQNNYRDYALVINENLPIKEKQIEAIIKTHEGEINHLSNSATIFNRVIIFLSAIIVITALLIALGIYTEEPKGHIWPRIRDLDIEPATQEDISFFKREFDNEKKKINALELEPTTQEDISSFKREFDNAKKKINALGLEPATQEDISSFTEPLDND
jgi:type IV secretion system protein VirD4